jgi:hypothetical protein
VAQGVGPEFKPPVLKEKKKERKKKKKTTIGGLKQCNMSY